MTKSTYPYRMDWMSRQYNKYTKEISTSNQFIWRTDFLKDGEIVDVMMRNSREHTRKEGVPIEAIMSFYIYNQDIVKGSRGYNHELINEYYNAGRTFAVIGYTHNGGTIGCHVNAKHIYEAIGLYMEHFDIHIDPNEYPKRFVGFYAIDLAHVVF